MTKTSQVGQTTQMDATGLTTQTDMMARWPRRARPAWWTQQAETSDNPDRPGQDDTLKFVQIWPSWVWPKFGKFGRVSTTQNFSEFDWIGSDLNLAKLEWVYGGQNLVEFGQVGSIEIWLNLNILCWQLYLLNLISKFIY